MVWRNVRAGLLLQPSFHSPRVGVGRWPPHWRDRGPEALREERGSMLVPGPGASPGLGPAVWGVGLWGLLVHFSRLGRSFPRGSPFQRP